MLPIYILRKKAMGDVLWIEPVIRTLAAKHKKVIVQTYSNELFENYPLPNVRFKYKLNWLEKLGRNLHLPNFINLDGAYEKTPKMHLLHAYQREAGLPETEEYPHLYPDESEKAKYRSEKYVVLHFEGSSDKNFRLVYGIDWRRLIDTITARGYKVFYTGRRVDTFDTWGASFAGTSIRDLIALIFNASLFVGIDSGPSHIAASFRIPSVLFFGAVKVEYRHFARLFKGQIMQGACEFAGCFHEKPGKQGPGGLVCRVVGNEGIPPCSLHDNARVLKAVTDALK